MALGKGKVFWGYRLQREDNRIANGVVDVGDGEGVELRHGSDALEIVKGFKAVAAAPLRLARGGAELADAFDMITAAMGTGIWSACGGRGGNAVFCELGPP